MKTLIITRHGKAESGTQNSDMLRELSPRGLKNINTIASNLQKINAIPEYIITSPSFRTLDTANQMIKFFNEKIPIYSLKSLYLGVSTEILHLIESICTDEDTVMIIGHNPSLEDFIKIMSDVTLQLPTSGTVVIDFDVNNWNEVSKGQIRDFLVA